MLIGLTLKQYWNITPKEFYYYVDAYNERLVTQDSLNHMFGRYIGFAVNDPKKYPVDPFLKKDKKSDDGSYNLREMNPEDIDKAMESIATKFNARAENGKNR